MSGELLGYARVSTSHQSNDAQCDELLAAGVSSERLYVDKLTGTSRREDRPGLAALLAYAREGDVIVVKGVDRLGRDAAEVLTTIKELLDRGIVIRTLREGVDSSTATGRMVMGIMASLAELELELQRERREASKSARRARGLAVGRPKKLSAEQVGLLERMRAAGEPVPVIAEALGVSRATAYRILAEGGS